MSLPSSSTYIRYLSGKLVYQESLFQSLLLCCNFQLEERAMEELKTFYEKKAKHGEVISVKRIKNKVGNVIPFWDRVLH